MKKNIKGFVLGLIVATLLMGTVFGAGIQKTIEVALNKVNVTVNGEAVLGDNILYEGTTYVPLRAIGEMLGKDIGWDGGTNTASINDKKAAVSKDGVKVFEDDKVKISYLQVTSSGMEFMVDNKTDVVVTIQADTLAVNGLSVSDYIMMSDDVSPKSRGKVVAQCNIENRNEGIEKISGQLRIIDFGRNWDSYDATFVNVKIK